MENAHEDPNKMQEDDTNEDVTESADRRHWTFWTGQTANLSEINKFCENDTSQG